MATYKAEMSRPSGFRDVDAHKQEVSILGFIWGKSRDVGRYSDNREECAMAIVSDALGNLSAVPVSNLKLTEPQP